ncbi:MULTISPECIES: hypothetical protein [Prochlorococcus]|uniref:Uncharacterized protein n=1 Tax=Prochlorococcus marinus (strain SARG / CCMP1375 / SS120) TaxID=167539 RepID=Q7VCS6_PROMA|nr:MULTISPECIES: hypothetical protein [Prochlorococcus]AAP99708.1 Predicted protein [Prochlorococcus marinus subsp. marinus str. CCMP1375]KGG13393.1 hypothetical protein EV04_0628 [Prochlorococcus marinus str. LG]KGG21363.1 hypothetical protein EV08_0771 [Prochlorococcus marinus str. SS2]KGG24305.1 hypothetical protein EV09_0352 [Prochlorococcus marinus str. SS35]KGG33589.1 hypothetical protein EV10_0429 [Prochlorococcus marinus str. SS51]
MQSLFLIVMLLGTEAAIEGLEAFKLIALIGLAAVTGPLVIGGLFFLLKKEER